MSHKIYLLTMLCVSPLISDGLDLNTVGSEEDRRMISILAPAYYLRGKGSPAEFITNNLSAGEAKRAIYYLQPERLRREYFSFGDSPEAARKVLRKFVADAERGFMWKRENLTVELRRTGKVPEIDGIIAPGEWAAAGVLYGEVPLDIDGEAKGATRWMCMYDERFLYLAAVIPDDDIVNDESIIYNGDSVEFFIMPDLDMRGYWEFIVSPGNRAFSAWHLANDHGGFISRRDVRPRSALIAGKPHAGGYAVELALPFSALPVLAEQALPYDGAVIRIMMLRTDMSHGKYRKSAPVPLLYDGHNFAGYINAVLK